MKSVVIKGLLGQGNTLDYILTPNTEFSIGSWIVTVNSLVYNCLTPNVNLTSILSSNCSRSQMYSAMKKEVINFQQPFGLFQIKTGTHSISLSSFSCCFIRPEVRSQLLTQRNLNLLK